MGTLCVALMSHAHATAREPRRQHRSGSTWLCPRQLAVPRVFRDHCKESRTQ